MPSTRRVGGVGERDELEQARALGGAAARAGEPLVQLEHLVGACTSPGSGRARRDSRAPRARRASRRAHRRPRRRRAVGRTSPTAIFTSVDLPAPFGPSRPTSSPSADLEVDALQRLDRAVALREPADGESSAARRRIDSTLCSHATRLHGRSRRPKKPSGARTSIAREARRARSREGVSRRLRLHDGRPGAALPRLARRRRPGRALRVGQGVGRHGAPRRRSATLSSRVTAGRHDARDRDPAANRLVHEPRTRDAVATVRPTVDSLRG